MTSGVRVVQVGNTVSGHQAGRDINIYEAPRRISSMQTLIAQYREELSKDEAFRQTIDELQHFLLSNDALSGVQGLESKLVKGGRENEVVEATRKKELFAKKLEKHRLSQAAQQIFAYLLARVLQLFRSEIRPLIHDNVSPVHVDSALVKKVYEPLLSELEDNVLFINPVELEGMLYYLTGNCHLRWDTSC